MLLQCLSCLVPRWCSCNKVIPNHSNICNSTVGQDFLTARPGQPGRVWTVGKGPCAGRGLLWRRSTKGVTHMVCEGVPTNQEHCQAGNYKVLESLGWVPAWANSCVEQHPAKVPILWSSNQSPVSQLHSDLWLEEVSMALDLKLGFVVLA